MIFVYDTDPLGGKRGLPVQRNARGARFHAQPLSAWNKVQRIQADIEVLSDIIAIFPSVINAHTAAAQSVFRLEYIFSLFLQVDLQGRKGVVVRVYFLINLYLDRDEGRFPVDPVSKGVRVDAAVLRLCDKLQRIQIEIKTCIKIFAGAFPIVDAQIAAGRIGIGRIQLGMERIKVFTLLGQVLCQGIHLRRASIRR